MNIIEVLFEVALGVIFAYLMRDVLIDCLKAFKKEHRWQRIFKISKIR